LACELQLYWPRKSDSRHLGSRDRYIGWNAEARRRNIRFIAYNTRFLILPWVRVPHLASHILGRMAAVLSDDLSLEAARQHYPNTRLYTDDEGARVLIDELELPFERVSTCLNKLQGEDPEWWALGKLEAYARQDAPFVHVDTDVFLWNPLAPEVENAGVLAQNPEPIFPGASCYRPDELERALGYPGTGALPKEWLWYRGQTAGQRPNAAEFSAGRMWISSGTSRAKRCGWWRPSPIARFCGRSAARPGT
jgi:hypothetical protein